MQKSTSSALKKSSQLISLNQLSKDTIDSLLRRAGEFKERNFESVIGSMQKRAIVALFFFEASTRTSLSFHTATLRLGHQVMSLPENSSLSKGETPLDTLLNAQRMGVELFILRAGEDLNMDEIPKELSFINAGWGATEHPTQALLDLMTLEELSPRVRRILILGDIQHSRVAQSLSALLPRYEYEVDHFDTYAFSLSNHTLSESKILLQDKLKSADVVYLLRSQKERHQKRFETQNYHQNWGLTFDLLDHHSHLKVMHPGPINYGEEVFHGIHNHPRSLILNQVTNSTFTRAAVIEHMLGGDT